MRRCFGRGHEGNGSCRCWTDEAGVNTIVRVVTDVSSSHIGPGFSSWCRGHICTQHVHGDGLQQVNVRYHLAAVVAAAILLRDQAPLLARSVDQRAVQLLQHEQEHGLGIELHLHNNHVSSTKPAG